MLDDGLIVAAAYLIGSIPTGYLLTRAIASADLRTVGSGGTGATNTVRALGWRWGVVVLLVDLLKGAAAVLLARGLDASNLSVALAAAMAVIGHCWPVWLRFRGGKGVATGAGAAVTLTPWALLLVPILVVPVLLTRYVSLGSIAGALAAPVLFAILIALDRVPGAYLAFALAAAVAVLWRHRTNIERLRAGTERRLGRPRSVAEVA
jgi:glycerol-3-phosphate acyltransferase PlsY